MLESPIKINSNDTKLKVIDKANFDIGRHFAPKMAQFLPFSPKMTYFDQIASFNNIFDQISVQSLTEIIFIYSSDENDQYWVILGAK